MTDILHSADCALPSRRVSFHTLGCKLNFAETSTLARLLEERGWVRAQSGEEPDLCVVNTCSVTEVADKKGRALLRRLHREHPHAHIIATGCYAQLKPGEVAHIEGVSLVLGQDRKADIARLADMLDSIERRVQVQDFKHLSQFVPACGHGERTRFWLKVQDGCDYWCSYCTIPMARGRSRSPRVADCVSQARRAAEAGAREIVLTGVNVGDFGRGTDEDFLSLIMALDRVEGVERFRISSIEPNLLTPDIIAYVAESRAFMPHFHIPLQSGSDKVLALMRRRYDTSLFASRIELIRSTLPDAFIGVDVIAGSRGESADLWQESLNFCSRLDVQQLHVFPYSERPGTRALTIEGCVEPAEKHRRVAELLAVSEQKYAAFLQRMQGTCRDVLWEQPHDDSDVMLGFTDNYVRVQAPLQPQLINTVTPVRLGAPASPDILTAIPL